MKAATGSCLTICFGLIRFQNDPRGCANPK